LRADGEYLNTWVNEVYDVEGIVWKLTALELALVIVVNEQANGTIQSIRASRETPG